MNIEEKLGKLEALHRIQVQNGRYYFWVEEDDFKHSQWQEKADQTKEEILKLKKEHNIKTPNWWE